MKLTTGLKTNKELAEWFGIASNSFNKTKQKKLEELEAFANYHLEGKKVYIDEVLIPEYSKQGSKNYKIVKNKIDEVWADNGLDSCTRVSEKIVEECTGLALAEGTVYNYTRRGRNELYGVPYCGGGTIGSCEYVWCKKQQDENGETFYSFLTKEEEEKKDELSKKYFGNVSDKQLFVQGMVKKGEISKEQAWDILTELTNMTDVNFMDFLFELRNELGFMIVKGTYVNRLEDSIF